MRKIAAIAAFLVLSAGLAACNTTIDDATVGQDCPSIGLRGTTPQGTQVECSEDGHWVVYWVR